MSILSKNTALHVEKIIHYLGKERAKIAKNSDGYCHATGKSEAIA
jgi:hypothetical protein